MFPITKVYLDNCCYNRPYDDQLQFKIAMETQCKLRIQEMIRQGKVILAASYMLRYECIANPYTMRRETIMNFIHDFAGIYIGTEQQENVIAKANEIMRTGIKYKDACHVACAILSGCDFFVSTDKRLLKYRTDAIKMVTPVEFIMDMEGE